ncbi:hypothetical protein [Mycolicibacterium sp. F2034L]|uniref:hypothetical protein n=1 Tax=Mycolicibacterium sp. F2034L TaxID=2926422 RepID=UPI001FF5D0B1|nr:hypothetical protein [Mycolicibacterium sp. F2034L]MCK0177613.1 hypothetical protein [Mycolicibacterium sp. F2034L]
MRLGATAFTPMGAIPTARAVVKAFIAQHRLTGSTPNPGCQAAVPLDSVTTIWSTAAVGDGSGVPETDFRGATE